MVVFPRELIDLITDHLHDDKDTLFSCSEVAWSWMASSRPHAFSEVSLDSISSTKEFNKIISSQHCTLPRFVETLSIRWRYEGNDGNFSNRDFPKIIRPKLLQKLSKITSLKLSNIPWCDINPEFMIHGFGEETFPLLERLELNAHEFRSFDTFADVVSCFPTLQSLELDEFVCSEPFDLESDTLAMNVSFESLIELSLCFGYHGDVLDFLRSCGATSQVESLLLSSVHRANVSSIARFLKASGTTLRFLRFGFLSFDASGDAELFHDMVDLQYNTNVHTLWIEDFTHAGQYKSRSLTTPGEWIIKIISKLNSTSLQVLVLEAFLPVISESKSHKRQLVELDNASGPQFRSLKELRLLHRSSSANKCADNFDDYFPICKKKGIIRLVY